MGIVRRVDVGARVQRGPQYALMLVLVFALAVVLCVLIGVFAAGSGVIRTAAQENAVSACLFAVICCVRASAVEFAKHFVLV